MLEYEYICCEDLELLISDPRNRLRYNSILREYGIVPDKKHKITTMIYCPWCATKLPSSLREELLDILEKEYNLDIGILDVRDNKDIPPEFQSDEWWKNRGL